MGWFSNACSAVGSFVSSAISTVGNAIKTVGEKITTTAKAFLSIGVKVFETVAKIIVEIAKALGLVDENETEEEIGAKTEVAEKNRDEFDSDKAYLEYLRKDVELPKGYIDDLSKEEKLAARAKGAALLGSTISEELDYEIDPTFWLTAARKGFDAKETYSIIEKFKVNDLESTDLMEFSENKLSPEFSQKTAEVIREALRSDDVGMGEMEAKEAVIDLKQLED